MNLQEFHREFGRLEKHFRMDDDNRKTIVSDWFKALTHYHVDAFSNAVDDVIQNATDTFWPALGKITSAIRSRMDRYAQTKNNCPTCHGSLWIESQPTMSNGFVYENFQRCPDCGVPPPDYSPNRYGSRPLTATEYAHWMQGTLKQPEIYIARAHPLVAQALKAIRPLASMKPLAKDVSMADALAQTEPGENG